MDEMFLITYIHCMKEVGQRGGVSKGEKSPCRKESACSFRQGGHKRGDKTSEDGPVFFDVQVVVAVAPFFFHYVIVIVGRLNEINVL